MLIHDLEQRSVEWYEVRRGLPTASNFDQILTKKTLVPCKNGFHYMLAAEILCGSNSDPWAGNNTTDHGLESENDAIKEYEALIGAGTKAVGFVTDDAKTMGCSPDRFAGDDGMLEIKSPMAKNMVQTFCESGGECPTDYRLQIQGQLMICERQWCDLALYHPAMELKIIRVMPDLDIHAKLKEQIKAVSRMRDDAVLTMSGI